METQILFDHTKIYNLQKIVKKKPKIFQGIITYDWSQVSTQAPKISCFKNPHIKIDAYYYYYLGAYKKSLKLLYSIMNLNTISLRALVASKANKQTNKQTKYLPS
jgi:hypothetical protein